MNIRLEEHKLYMLVMIGLAMAFKLIESARARWRAVHAPHLVAMVRAGAIFRDGVLPESPEQAAA